MLIAHCMGARYIDHIMAKPHPRLSTGAADSWKKPDSDEDRCGTFSRTPR